MKLIVFLLLFSNLAFCQNFGDVAIQLHAQPQDQRDMHYYKWYVHPDENNIYIKNFETTLSGLLQAFSEAEKMLSENDLEFSKPATDASQFHPEINQSPSLVELHVSISENKSKILRTWSIDGDYLSLLVRNDVCMLILGEKRSD